jgi:AcrR family transcriptional regulator
MKQPSPKYRRESPETRREHLVAATLRCLSQHGHQGVSVRRIATASGVSVGLINHHYASIEDLIAHAYETLASGIVEKLLAEVDRADPTPRARLSAFFAASFSPLVLDPALLGVWVVFWSMIRHSAVMQAVQKRSFRAYQAVLEKELGALVAEAGVGPLDVGLLAVGLAALLDGSWLEWSLNPTGFQPEAGVRLCEAWVDALCAGGFARLRPA